MRVSVVYALPRHQKIWEVELGPGATVADALRAAGVMQEIPGIDWSREAVGVSGRVRSLATLLNPGDRVEIYRPRQVDPKVRRQQRLQRP